MNLTGRIVRVEEISPRRRGEMFMLMAEHYDGMRRAEFEADLDEKDWVIELVDPATGALCGFSTQMVFATEAAGRPVRALFSGDTIVAWDCRARHPLAGLWGGLALSLIERFTGEELYWFLISKGYKTYRFLPLFFREFYPRVDAATPASIAAVLDAFGRHKFPRSYDPGSGVVRASDGGCRLRPGVADLTAERRRDPHVRFFCARNPRHADGDELCCVAPLTRENFTPAAWRVIGAAPELPEHAPGLIVV